MFLYSSVFSQIPLKNRNINLQLNDVSLIEVIKAIEKQSGISFVYNTALMKNAQNMCIDVNELDLRILLDTICKRSVNNYKVINNQVVFFKVAAQSTESINISIKPRAEEIKQSHGAQKPILKDTFHNVNNISNLNIVEGVGRNGNVLQDTIPPLFHRNNSKLNCELIHSISPKITNRIKTNNNAILALKDYNSNKSNNIVSKSSTSKYFYSFQISNLIGISSGFKSGDSLSSEKSQVLNRSVSSFGYKAGINIGYTIKHFSFKSGLVYTQFNEEFKEKLIYNQFLTQIEWKVITWQEQSPDGIVIYTDTIPISQTIIRDSIVTSVNKYNYRFIEIPFNIDYTLTLNSKWSMFSSIGFTYGFTLMDSFSSHSSAYKPNSVNKLDISAELNLGLKFYSNHLQYYFMTGGVLRSAWFPKDTLLKRNPVYLNFALGIINYF